MQFGENQRNNNANESLQSASDEIDITFEGGETKLSKKELKEKKAAEKKRAAEEKKKAAEEKKKAAQAAKEAKKIEKQNKKLAKKGKNKVSVVDEQELISPDFKPNQQLEDPNTQNNDLQSVINTNEESKVDEAKNEEAASPYEMS